MKKLFYLAMMGAIAFTGAIGFTACSSEDDVANNPTFDGESVKTSFALNIPYAQKGTRMAETTVQGQATPVFRGMENIFLFPLSQAPTAGSDNQFPFTNIPLAAIANDDINATTQSSKVYSDVNIAVGTSNFLFYGTAATKTASTSSNATKFSNGYVGSTLATTNAKTSDIEFSLNPIHSTVTTALTTPENYLVSVLNYIMQANDGATTPTTWASYKESTDARYQVLKDDYNALTRADIRGGSANAVLYTVNALYNNIAYALSITADNTDNATLRAIYANILARIENYFTATATGATGFDAQGYRLDAYTLAYKTGAQNINSVDYTVDAKITNFPAEQDLPEGAAQLTWNTTSNQFEYLNTPKVVNGTTDVIDVTKICFPVELMYYCNTPVKASNKVIPTTGTGAWPKFKDNNTGNWDDDNYWTNTTLNWQDVVSSTTRSIALRDNINYGVALLKVTIKANGTASGSDYVLTDNAAAKGAAAEDQNIPIASAGFPLSGVFVGGQPSIVGWNYLSAATAQGYKQNADRTMVIYDRSMNESPAATNGTATGCNYTLVFDNYKQGAAAADQDAVNVAVELTNNTGQDFYGTDGLIRKGQKFYLIGRLDPKAASGKTGTIEWPANTTTGKYGDRFPANNVERVFIQDYTTIANFTIQNLKNAYVTIPDLRVAQLQLGLSVDLQWRAGVTYDVDL